jgi:phage/conjugal plasmid C-4 type zinc finger TraR family protein
MSDEIDQANDRAAFDTDLALRHARLTREHGDQRYQQGRVVCVDCGTDIPPARLLSLPHCWRCVDCQTAHEHEIKRWS